MDDNRVLFLEREENQGKRESAEAYSFLTNTINERIENLGLRKKGSWMIYGKHIKTIEGDDNQLFWVGERENDKGQKIQGGMLDKKYFYFGYKMIITRETIEIFTMEWEELVDLMFDNLFTEDEEIQA